MSNYSRIRKSRRSSGRARCLLVYDGTRIMAQGLPAMAEFLRMHGHTCEVWNLFSERKSGIEDNFEARLGEFDVLGIAIHWFYQIVPAVDLARRAKNTLKDIFVVAGGFTASMFAHEIVFKYEAFNGVIRGDGEVPLLRLCEEISTGNKRLNRVPNLVYRDRQGNSLQSSAPVFVADKSILDSLDFGNLSSMRNLHTYIHMSSWREITDGSEEIHFDIDSTFYLCGGRGCSVQCMYCGGGKEAHRLHSMRKRNFIFRSPSRIADDLQQAMTYGYRSFHVCFDPSPNGRHWFEFMKEIRKRGIRTNFIFECFSIPSEKFIRTAAETFDGVIMVISPETSIENIRKKCKGFYYTNRQMEKCLEKIGKYSMAAQLFFGYFLPGDDEKTIEVNLEYIDKLTKTFGDFTNIFYYPYSTDPGSPAQLNPEKHKLNCPVRTFEDYHGELGRREKLRGNLLRHFPMNRGKETWDMLSLRIELERACCRRCSETAKEIRSTMKKDTGKFYTELAKELLRETDISLIKRNILHQQVLRYYKGMGV